MNGDIDDFGGNCGIFTASSESRTLGEAFFYVRLEC